MIVFWFCNLSNRPGALNRLTLLCIICIGYNRIFCIQYISVCIHAVYGSCMLYKHVGFKHVALSALLQSLKIVLLIFNRFNIFYSC